MHHNYADIRDLIPTPPIWFDERAVPRYCSFSPNAVANIYADEVVLVLIACQNCGKRFKVAMSTSTTERALIGFGRTDGKEPMSLAVQIGTGWLHYGDPPNAGCCGAGPTMGCEDLAVLEYWRRNGDTSLEWERDHDHEIRLDYEEERDEHERESG